MFGFSELAVQSVVAGGGFGFGSQLEVGVMESSAPTPP